MKHLLSTLACSALLALPASATRYYVDDDAAPGGDGLSWATAFDSLDDILPTIASGDRIWLAEGTYVPSLPLDPADPRTVTFLLPGGVRIYGGFDGTENTLAERAGLFDQTLLTGEIGAPGILDNAYHVVYALHPSGIPPGSTRLDGMTIANGNASQAGGQGGGVLSFNIPLRLTNVTVRDNAAVNGAGVHVQPASATFIDCDIHHNRALNNGGGVWGQAVNIKAFNTRFHHNTAGQKGGGAYMHSSSGVFEVVLYAGCIFDHNFAQRGGGMFVGGGNYSSGSAVLRNCTFAFNGASVLGGGVHANTSPALPARVWLYDSIVWGNNAPNRPGVGGRMLIEYCDVQDVLYSPTHGNLRADPLFVDSANGDFRLAAGSPCIDAGSNSLVARDHKDLDNDGDSFEPVPFDFDGLPRFADDPGAPDTGSGTAPIVDIGAHERPAN